MKAMLLKQIGPISENTLSLEEIPKPKISPSEILVRIATCGVCHTELDELEGRLKANLPIILGHEIVGHVEEMGERVKKFKKNDRIGIAWINSACGSCEFCKRGNENLCEDFKGTGLDANGGYAEYTVIDEKYAFPIPKIFSDFEAAPLLCAGAIGYRALKLSRIKNGEVLGLFGFGASAHLVIQLAKYKFPNLKVYVFSRPGKKGHQEFAKSLGADWVGTPAEKPPKKLDAAIDFTPSWKIILSAMSVLNSGGRLVINAIRKEEGDKKELLNIEYEKHIWQEKELKSVANITAEDAEEFIELAAKIPIKSEVQEFKLEEANIALKLLKEGKIKGAAVLNCRS